MTTRSRFRILYLACFMTVGLMASAGMAAPASQQDLRVANWHPVHVRVLTGHFDASESELKAAATRLETPGEMTVAFFLARTSDKPLSAVLRRRGKGLSWSEIRAAIAPSSKPAAGPNGIGRPTSLRLRVDSSDQDFEKRVGARVTAEFFNTAPSLVLAALRQGHSLLEVQTAFLKFGRAPVATWAGSHAPSQAPTSRQSHETEVRVLQRTAPAMRPASE